MAHFLVVSQPFASHVAVLEALASALAARGHRVGWAGPADVLAQLHDPRIERHVVGARAFPPGALAAIVDRAAHPRTPWGLRRVVQDMADATAMFCEELPARLGPLGVDAIVADQMEAAGGLVADAAGLPFASVACALPIEREENVPLPVMPWPYATDDAMRVRHRVSERMYDAFMGPHGAAIRAGAARLGLAPRASMHECLSPRLRIAQTAASFDFPRRELPPSFVHVGPIRPADARHAAFDRAIDPSRPFVFASLGTLQGGRAGLFRRIAAACRALDAQLLVAHCGLLDAAQCRDLVAAGATWVEAFAPQQAVLAKADVLVTHAGLNTVLDALVAGRPMLALPLAFDQPGVAARIVHHGAGLRLSPRLASAGAIRAALRRLLDEAAFRDRARALGADLAAGGGASRAARRVEERLVAHASTATAEAAA